MLLVADSMAAMWRRSTEIGPAFRSWCFVRRSTFCKIASDSNRGGCGRRRRVACALQRLLKLASALACFRELLQRRCDGAWADRGTQLTASLLAFARKQPLQPAEIDVNELIREAERLLSPAIGQRSAAALPERVVDTSCRGRHYSVAGWEARERARCVPCRSRERRSFRGRNRGHHSAAAQRSQAGPIAKIAATPRPATSRAPARRVCVNDNAR